MMRLCDIAWNVPEEEYREDPAYSYSILAKYERGGFESLPTLFDRVESPSLLFGSIVDCLITGTEQEFNERFIVGDYDVTESVEAVVRSLEYRPETSLIKVPDDVISDACVANNYYANDKYKSYRIKKIREEGEEFFRLLKLGVNKTLINSELYNQALACKDALKTSNATKWYFEDNNPFDPTVERFYQLKFKGEYNGIPLRCMADLLIVNSVDKQIIPVDLKTSFKKEYNFYKSFIEWSYFIQALCYSEIIRQNLIKYPEFSGYSIAPYRFIVVNKESLNPLVWVYEESAIKDITKPLAIQERVYGKDCQIVCRDWRVILQELDNYIKNDSKVPNYINEDSDNSLVYWLNEM